MLSDACRVCGVRMQIMAALARAGVLTLEDAATAAERSAVASAMHRHSGAGSRAQLSVATW